MLGEDNRASGPDHLTQQLRQETLIRDNQLSDERVETKRRMRIAAEIQREESLARHIEMVGLFLNLGFILISPWQICSGFLNLFCFLSFFIFFI